MSTTPDILLAANGLSVNAAGRTLLENVNVQLHAGEVLGIVGPNGAGKSTLLKALSGAHASYACVWRRRY